MPEPNDEESRPRGEGAAPMTPASANPDSTADQATAATSQFAEMLAALGYAANETIFVAHQNDSGHFADQKIYVGAAPQFAQILADRGANIWFTPASFKQKATGRKSSEATGLHGLHLDLDYKEAGIRTEENARTLIDNMSMFGTPSVIVHTGGGMQPHWALKRLITVEGVVGVGASLPG